MNHPKPTVPQLQVSLGGMCRATAVVALLFTCLLPFRQVDLETLTPVLFLGALLTPLVLLLAVQVLLHRGVLRLWLSGFLAGVPLVLLVVTCLFGAVEAVISWIRGRDDRGMVLLAIPLALVAYGLGRVLVRLVRFLIPAWCPLCARKLLFHDMRPSDRQRLHELSFGRCAGCGTRFRRRPDRRWRAVEPSARAIAILLEQPTRTAEREKA